MRERGEEVRECLRRIITEVSCTTAYMPEHGASVTCMYEDVACFLGEIEILGAGVGKLYQLLGYLLYVFVIFLSGKGNLLAGKSKQQD